eukprot:TRINITY_DN14429_c4_g1_i2.p1 TRINITY_DN14429_c4_g1~~TRINITY_DN14429_c4_g1_i2.p1  ORF type:complete len:398 (-),score=109.88 TRINITY_DN14429_c4_g1_i2:128-1162(-)
MAETLMPEREKESQDLAEEAVIIWRDLGNVKGEATAIACVVKALAKQGLEQEALLFVCDRLEELRRKGVRHGEIFLAPVAVSAMLDYGEAGEALALAEQSLSSVRKFGHRHDEAQMLLQISEIRLEKGELTDALKTAKEALSIFQEIGDMQGEEKSLETLTHVYTALNEAHKAPNRGKGIALLGELVAAARRQDSREFQQAFQELRCVQGVDDQDLTASLTLLFEEPRSRIFFIREIAAYLKVSEEEAEALVTFDQPESHLQRAKGYPRGGLYWIFRQGSMGYGPSFRPVQAIYRRGDQYGAGTAALSVLKDDTLEEWEQVALVQAHAGVLDGALQASAIPGAP